MESTRRGFLGLLGAAAAATAVPSVLGEQTAPALAGGKTARSATVEYVYIMSPIGTPPEGLPPGSELYATSVVVRITPLRRGRVTKKVEVTMGPKTEFSYKDDRVGTSFGTLFAGDVCRVNDGTVFREKNAGEVL